MIIILHWSEWLKDPKVERAPNWHDACTYVDALSNDRTAFIFDTAAQGDPWRELNHYRGRQLAEIYKAFGGEFASDRFTNYESGRRRTEQLIERLARAAPEIQLEEPMATTTKTRTFKPPALGEFTPVRHGTKLAQFLTLVTEGTRTLDDLATASGIEKTKVQLLLRSSLAKLHGIGHNINKAGIVTVVPPRGCSVDDLIKAAAEPKPSRASGNGVRRTKHDDAMERARAGETPPHLIITSEANKHRQKAVDRLEKLAADKDWDGVRDFTMNGIDTYSKMINRHRDLILAAHDAQPAVE